MKKKYIVPCGEEVQLSMESSILNASDPVIHVDINHDEPMNGTDALSRQKGDFWSTEQFW